jgi:NAD(P)H-hydrate epimerase
VLAGLVGALLAQGLGPFEAAASAAHVHGATTRAWGRSAGLVSDDLPELLPAAIASVRGR